MKFIDIYEGVEENFKDFLSNPNNERILFSAKFGVGKTTFLNHFFTKHEDNYNVFHIYPVNYSVHNNQDIFKLIKYDLILLLIVKHEFEFSKSKIDPVNYLPAYLHSRIYKLLLPLLTLKNPAIGTAIKAYDVINREIEKYLNCYAQEVKSENDLVGELSDQIFNDEGTIYEYNYLTDVIKDALESIKRDKLNVLVIDDLDRLDPHHIFRLLNVFAAHFDYSEDQKRIQGSNKYGFDRIIFSSDSNNIVNIYKHFYGKDTDVEGYLDKFYSSTIYQFDSNENILKIIEQIIKSKQITFSVGWSNADKVRLDRSWLTILISLIRLMLTNKVITMRSLVKYTTDAINIPPKSYNYFPSSTTIWNYELISIIIFKHLELILGSINRLDNVMEKLKESNFNTTRRETKQLVMWFRVPLDESHHKYVNGKNYNIEWEKDYLINGYNSFTVELSLVKGPNPNVFVVINETDISWESINALPLIYDSFILCKEREYI